MLTCSAHAAATLSGSYTNASCTKGCAATTDAWGSCSGSVTAKPAGGTETVTNSVTGYSGSETATCNASGTGAWAYSATSCTATTCSSPCGTIANGATCTAYLDDNPTGACTSQVRTCTNGTLSGTYTYASCSAGCSTPCGAKASGGTCVAYADDNPTGACSSQTRTCTNGTLSGSYAYASCAAGCSTPCGAKSSGGTCVAYAASSVACGSTCTSQTRTCTNGSLSGSYAYASCSVSTSNCPCNYYLSAYTVNAIGTCTDTCSGSTCTCAMTKTSGTTTSCSSWTATSGNIAATGCGASYNGALCGSDARLKTNIQCVGTYNGYNIYEFAYKAEPGHRYRGVLAQEVLHVPGAVERMPNGYYGVHYDVIGVPFVKIF